MANKILFLVLVILPLFSEGNIYSEDLEKILSDLIFYNVIPSNNHIVLPISDNLLESNLSFVTTQNDLHHLNFISLQ